MEDLAIEAEAEPVPAATANLPEETFEPIEAGVESAFDSKAWNTTIGLGGGAGGVSGRRAAGHSAAPSRTRESYAPIVEHGWLAPGEHPLSTFAVDVDGASWSNVRRFLRDGRLPPADAVRVEECVNWFRYEIPAPEAGNDHPLALHIETGPCPWQPAHHLLRMVLHAAPVADADPPPRNLVFLVDVSGSMSDANKLPLLQRALRMLVRTLRPIDHVALVTYADEARVVLEPTRGSERVALEAALEGLAAGGSTNGESGIRMAYDLARRQARAGTNSRVLLATDGDFNVGVSEREALVDLIERERAGGVFLSVLGFGEGNLKDATLEALGRHGNGHYAYVDSIAEARRVLVEQVGATLDVVAKDVKVQLELNPLHVAAYRQVGHENRALAARDFNDDGKDAGEMGAGHVVTALYEIVPPGPPSPVPTVDPLRYRAPGPESSTVAAATRAELLTVKVRYAPPAGGPSRRFERFVAAGAPPADTSTEFRFAAAVAAFALVLRGSPHAGSFGFDGVRALAEGARGADLDGERAEFLTLVQMAADLAGTELAHR